MLRCSCGQLGHGVCAWRAQATEQTTRMDTVEVEDEGGVSPYSAVGKGGIPYALVTADVRGASELGV